MEQCNCCHKAYPIKKESHSQLNDHMQLSREYTCREQQQKNLLRIPEVLGRKSQELLEKLL